MHLLVCDCSVAPRTLHTNANSKRMLVTPQAMTTDSRRLLTRRYLIAVLPHGYCCFSCATLLRNMVATNRSTTMRHRPAGMASWRRSRTRRHPFARRWLCVCSGSQFVRPSSTHPANRLLPWPTRWVRDSTIGLSKMRCVCTSHGPWWVSSLSILELFKL